VPTPDSGMIIYVCSTNRGKLAEFALSSREAGLSDILIEPHPGLGHISAPQENGNSFEENARAKAIYYSAFTSELVLADDSGLEVEALSGEPGVYSARYAGENAADSANNELLLRRLDNARDRRARFVCVVALAEAGRVLHTAHGSAEGEILWESRGEGGFGYDPLFFYPPLQRSFAELTPGEKFAVSHRGKALRELFNWLRIYTRK
jgi:XTP/dITP diphosphohydrolase